MRVRSIRKTHRWLGLFIGVQLLLWTVSGLYFSWNPIERVRGEDLAAPPPSLELADTLLASPGVVLQAMRQAEPGIVAVQYVTLRMLLGEPVYEVAYLDQGRPRYALADARTGQLRGPLSEEEAVAVARQDFLPEASVRGAERVTSVSADAEYRGKELPAYRVTFDHETGTRLYVSADRGLVTARRGDTWRTFDFFWMLHIMDYQARDNFNHWLLRILSVLGVITVLSGFLLWGVTSPWLRKRRRPRAAARIHSGNVRPVATLPDGTPSRLPDRHEKPHLKKP